MASPSDQDIQVICSSVETGIRQAFAELEQHAQDVAVLNAVGPAGLDPPIEVDAIRRRATNFSRSSALSRIQGLLDGAEQAVGSAGLADTAFSCDCCSSFFPTPVPHYRCRLCGETKQVPCNDCLTDRSPQTCTHHQSICFGEKYVCIACHGQRCSGPVPKGCGHSWADYLVVE